MSTLRTPVTTDSTSSMTVTTTSSSLATSVVTLATEVLMYAVSSLPKTYLLVPTLRSMFFSFIVMPPDTWSLSRAVWLSTLRRVYTPLLSTV